MMLLRSAAALKGLVPAACGLAVAALVGLSPSAASATVSLGSAACFAVLSADQGGSVALAGPTTTIRGSVGLGAGATQDFSSGRIIGELLVDPAAADSHANAVGIAGGAVKTSLQQPVQDAAAAAAAIAALKPTQRLGAITASKTIEGNGGVNVVAVRAITLDGTSTLTLSGGANDVFYVQVAGNVRLGGASQILLAGVPVANVFFDLAGGTVQLSGTSVANGTFLAFGGGAGQAISVSHATLNGAVLAASRALSLSQGATINPPCIAANEAGPIQAPANRWTWVPFWDAFCANGTTTGVGVNLRPGSSDVLIYLEGGGACWSELTCYVLETAAYFTTGYGPATFAADIAALATKGSFFDRTATKNPFRNYSYVFVPYCTGDIHAGRNVAQYGTHTALHVGGSNVSAYLQRLVATFPTAKHVVLAGSSAGGFGAAINWGPTQLAFGSVPVDMIDDSGTFMPPDILPPGTGFQPEQEAAWNLIAALPAACSACVTGLDALYGFYATALPDDRGALLSYTQDTVLPSYFGITEAQFTTGLDEVLATDIKPHANLHSFVVTGAGHVLLFDPTLATDGVTLETFLTKMVTGAAWKSVPP